MMLVNEDNHMGAKSARGDRLGLVSAVSCETRLLTEFFFDYKPTSVCREDAIKILRTYFDFKQLDN